MLSIVIPVYNESPNLEPLHHELCATLNALGKPYEILFVDDGSTDDSFTVLKDLSAADPHVRVIRFRRNFGQTAAFAAGFDYARGEIIITMDADGQNDPADIPALLEKLESGDYDVVTGWRVERKEGFARRFLSKVANRLISNSTQITVHDRGCSLKAFRSEVAKQMRLYGQLHRFLPELAAIVGARVAEVPVNDRARRAGKSKYGAISRTPRVLLDLLTVFFMLTFFTSPMRLFGGMGLISTALGLFTGGYLTLAKLYHGLAGGWAGFRAYEIGNRPMLLLAVLLVIVGIQFLMMGLIGEMLVRVYHESQNKPIYTVREVIGGQG
ncbi:MAG: glycosyltransferase [Anaerolineae bacterium]|nr:MAG: glycosyltransferase [Anaerolineae bacterium]